MAATFGGAAEETASIRAFLFPSVIGIVLVLAGAGDSLAQTLFFEDFEGTLSEWVGKDGGEHHGVIVPDPLRPGNHVLTFTGLNAAGDIFSPLVPLTSGGRLVLSFEYLGNPTLGGVPDHLGGAIGFAEDCFTPSEPPIFDAIRVMLEDMEEGVTVLDLHAASGTRPRHQRICGGANEPTTAPAAAAVLRTATAAKRTRISQPHISGPW